jgi:hypothetical protein
VDRTLRDMPDTLDTTAVEHTARQLLNARISAVRELATAQVAVDHARDALSAAETNHASVYTNATRAGWTDTELKQIGLTLPARRAPGRPRQPRANGSRTPASQSPNRATEPVDLDAHQTRNGG